MPSTGGDILDGLDGFLQGAKPTDTLIVCAVAGSVPPRYCEQLLREPDFSREEQYHLFSRTYDMAISLNRAFHDGAAIVGFSGHEWKLIGLSFRLFPPPTAKFVPRNVGTAHMSALHMSMLEEVLACVVCKEKSRSFFVDGLKVSR